jgi:hypothetical protein
MRESKALAGIYVPNNKDVYLEVVSVTTRRCSSTSVLFEFRS